MTDKEFLNIPGKLPWRLDAPKRNPKSGIVYDADNRLVCVAAIGNAREIVRMATLCHIFETFVGKVDLGTYFTPTEAVKVALENYVFANPPLSSRAQAKGVPK